MAETFNTVRSSTPDTTSGSQVAGDTFTQDSDTVFVAAGYLVYGPNGGPYERVDTATPLPVKEQRAATSSVTLVEAASTEGTTLQAANNNRLALAVYNNSTLDLYLKLGSGASSTSFTLIIAPNGYYEVPGHYTGVVTGTWPGGSAGTATSDGNALVTELTA